MRLGKEEEVSRRKKEQEVESPRSKDKDRIRTPKRSHRRRSTSRDRSRERDSDGSRLARSSMSDLPSRIKKVTMAVPEMDRRSSLGEPKPGSYPAFSKAHSREAVSRDESSKPKVSILTPDPTDVGRDNGSKSARPETPPDETSSRAPPSPPLTSDEADIRAANSANSSRRSGEGSRHDSARPRAGSHGSHLRAGNSPSPRKTTRSDDSDSSKTDASRPSTAKRSSVNHQKPRDAGSRLRESSERKASTSSVRSANLSDSQATSVAPERKRATPAPVRSSRDVSPPTRPSSAPRTPITQQPPMSYSVPPIQSFPVNMMAPSLSQPFISNMMPSAAMAPPPPPPPPMSFPVETPRVDYLLLNGGLPYLIPKALIPSSSHPSVQAYQQYASPRPQAQGLAQGDAAQIFAPIGRRLEDLNKVLDKSGSVAVATGYRSVARRLLDRLEHVFARNISSEKCSCVVCNTLPKAEISEEEEDGLSWGEILEFVSGRKELPQWPPFSLDTAAVGLGVTDRIATPMQRLDPDVPAEYREHYLKQNDKTKRSVQSWLEAQQPAVQTNPPVDVDDETLSFAMLTRLDQEKRPLFTALMKGLSTVPESRAPTPAIDPEEKNGVLERTALALQRLYRLRSRPRDPESTIYLLNNRHLHGVLATLAAISPAEWDILTSGRFDGFLWSGAESVPQSYTNPSFISRGPSRGPTPFRSMASPAPNSIPSRNPTPSPSLGGASSGYAPVQHDEETEIAVLAEVEREIYRGMEMLEDAFETLHQQAETIRQRLRERSAGLAMAAQARRGSDANDADMVRVGTPWTDAGDVDSDPVFDDGRSELAPDDSASNISYTRRRRHKTRERKTPAVVDEEDEGEAADGARRRRR